MSNDASSVGDIYPQRDPAETRSIADRLADVFRGHKPDPEDPGHRCLCGYDGESFDDHLATTTMRDLRDVGYEVFPIRHV